MQTTFERTHDNYNIVQKYRIDAEKQLEILQKQYEARKEEADEQLKRVLKAQEELNQLNRTLKQVEDYNEVMKSEIAVTRRTTYRAEENVVNLEKSKKKQDLLIDSMNEEIKRLNEQKTLYQAQLISQKEETAAARNTLKEAAIEIEKIVMSKKTLLEDWQKSLFGMQQRDKALQAIKDLIKQKNDEILQVESEITGVRNETRREQEVSEKLHEKLQKCKGEQDFLKARQDEIEADKKRLQEQYVMLKTSLQSTEEESARMDVEKSNVEEKMTILEKSVMQLHTKTKAIRDDIINHASQQKTIEKSSANLIKQTKVAYEQISKKEVEIEDIANEISRVRIDNLNTQSQNELLQKKLDDLINELKDKERDVEKFEGEIKQQHIKIAKKQHKVDRLNRQLDELKKKNGEDENAGPLEAKKNNIEKEINEKEEEITQVQKEWIANQTELIEQQNTLSTITRDCDDLRTQKTILEQKKMRLNNSVQGHEKEIRALEVALKNLDFEMNKLNDLYYKNTAQQTKMTNDNFNIENEFKQKLKELENESIKLESHISTLKEEKADILAEIVEAERQILLWERKIQLEREMQDALDPNIGQSEIVAMKKEIHRMELRYEQLRKKQE
jgi:chromosome segregation ATPase